MKIADICLQRITSFQQLLHPTTSASPFDLLCKGHGGLLYDHPFYFVVLLCLQFFTLSFKCRSHEIVSFCDIKRVINKFAENCFRLTIVTTST